MKKSQIPILTVLVILVALGFSESYAQSIPSSELIHSRPENLALQGKDDNGRSVSNNEQAPAFRLGSAELITNAQELDGKTVIYEGEVVGEVMKRGQSAWVNINDGANAIGVWCPLQMASVIAYTGSYKSRGDRLEVSGVLNHACRQHGGDLDIHAQEIRLISPGHGVKESLHLDERNYLIMLSGALLLLWILTRFIMR